MAALVRYLVACVNVENHEDGSLSLQQVLDTVYLGASDLPCEIQLTCVIGLRLDESAWNKTLGLITWQMQDGKKLELTYVDDALTMPEVDGFISLDFPVVLPIASAGEYGFELVDVDGVFANTEDAVGTFLFGVAEAT